MCPIEAAPPDFHMSHFLLLSVYALDHFKQEDVICNFSSYICLIIYFCSLGPQFNEKV